MKTGELAWAAAVVFWPAARRYEHTAACGGGGVPRRLSVLGPASVPARKREGGAGSALVRCKEGRGNLESFGPDSARQHRHAHCAAAFEEVGAASPAAMNFEMSCLSFSSDLSCVYIMCPAS